MDDKSKNRLPAKEVERVDFTRDRQYPNKVFERLMPKVGTEMILPGGALAKVTHHNPGKRRLTLQLVGYLRKK